MSFPALRSGVIAINIADTPTIPPAGPALRLKTLMGVGLSWFFLLLTLGVKALPGVSR